MNKQKYKIINDILQDKPNRLRESYFIKNYNDVHSEIVEYTKGIDLPFKQKMWHWVNELPTLYVCKCGKPTSFHKNWKDGYRVACSPKCAQTSDKTKEKRRKTTLDKYGVDNIAKSEESKKKQEETNIQKYGHKSTFQNKEVQKKWRKTIKNKYGVDHYFKTDEFKKDTKQYYLNKYGVDHQSKLKTTQDKIKETNIRKIGTDHITKTDKYWEDYRNKSLEKYGVDHPLKSKEIQDKIKKRNQDKYGVDYYYESDEFKTNLKKYFLDKYGVDHYSKSKEYKEYTKSERYKENILRNRQNFYNKKGFKFVSNSKRKGFVLLEKESCGHTFEIHPTTLQKRLDANIEACAICNPINSGKSNQEQNILNFLKDLKQDVIHGDRSLLYPYEIDFLINDKKIAIEYNGLYWHSEINKGKYYHYDKMIKCLDKGYKLINIWEDDWLYKQDIVRSILKNKLGLINNKLFARKCELRVTDDRKVINKFFDDNHLQGKTNFSHSIGLYHKEELVSCMLFHKNKNRIELVRFCNKINLNVTGAASKLFKYFTKNNNYDRIYSFSESSIFNGELYTSLNFNFDGETPINYWWNVGGIRKHRFSFNKKKLISMGGDPNKSETEIMHNMDNYRVWGCGLKRWVWKRD